MLKLYDEVDIKFQLTVAMLHKAKIQCEKDDKQRQAVQGKPRKWTNLYNKYRDVTSRHYHVDINISSHRNKARRRRRNLDRFCCLVAAKKLQQANCISLTRPTRLIKRYLFGQYVAQFHFPWIPGCGPSRLRQESAHQFGRSATKWSTTRAPSVTRFPNHFPRHQYEFSLLISTSWFILYTYMINIITNVFVPNADP